MAAKGKPKLTEEPLPARRPAKKSVLSESEDEEEEPVTATEPESAPEVPLSFSEECPVPRKSIPDADYFIDDGKKWHGKFKKKQSQRPSPELFSRGAEGTGLDADDDDALRRTLHWCSESAFFRELDLSPL